jgi:hypothetical protein
MRRSEQEKVELLEKWKASGKSRSAWCKEHGVSIITLNRLLEKLDSGKNGSMTKETIFAEANVDISDYRANGGQCVDFGEREFRSSEEAMIRVRVTGKVLEIYCAAEKSVLRNVLEAVAECL